MSTSHSKRASQAALPCLVKKTAAAIAVLLCAAFMVLAVQASSAQAASEDSVALPAQSRQVHILFTHDIHSYFEPTEGYVEGEVREHGGAARLATLINQNSGPNTIYLDAGDFSMGTLLQAGYASDAYELRLLGQLGCAVTTFGNHEWDYSGAGVADMLEAALASGDTLPAIVSANISFEGELTEEQQSVARAFADYGVKPYTILEVNGLKVGVFGVMGENAIADAPTSGMNWNSAIDSAKQIVAELEDQCDLIVCISHSGTKKNGSEGEDINLVKEVPGIDVVVSGHSHTYLPEPVIQNGSIVASSSEYLKFLGSLTVEIAEDGTVSCVDYELIPVDENVEEDASLAATIESYKQHISSTYLSDSPTSYEEVVAYAPFDFMSLDDMYATHQEYPMGDLIADSYLYEARANGVDDIDVALVALGTIRGSFFEGPITTSKAFEVCSLGVGADGSAGHPIVCAYISGSELKLLAELDASLGPLVNAIKMSYSGLSYTFNDNRMLLDRVTQINLVRPDGSLEEIQDDQLYKVCCNMYAANMLGMLNGLTKGLLSIQPKNADGSPVEEFYACSLRDTQGNEVKEWVAFRNYLMSFEKTDGISTIPDTYATAQDRKVKVSEGGLAVVANPGASTLVVIAVALVLVLLVVLILRFIIRKVKKYRARDVA